MLTAWEMGQAGMQSGNAAGGLCLWSKALLAQAAILCNASVNSAYTVLVNKDNSCS